MTTIQFILFGIVLGCAFCLLALAIYLGVRGRAPKAGEIVPEKEAMDPFIVWGVFYANPADPRGWVPKRRGYGYTVNLRHRAWAWVFVLLFLGVVLGGILLPFMGKK